MDESLKMHFIRSVQTTSARMPLIVETNGRQLLYETSFTCVTHVPALEQQCDLRYTYHNAVLETYKTHDFLGVYF